MFGPEVNAAIMKAALKKPDEEICGFIIDDKFRQVKNKHKAPKGHFNAGDLPDGAQAVVHSHPQGPFYPSEGDMRQQMASALPWGVACFHDLHKEVFWFGDQSGKAPLVGRGFRHGVTDCYSLIRDFYIEKHGLTIIDKPRSWEWWAKGENIYLDGLEQAGFVEIGKAQIRPGDGFLATIRSKAINHGGIYIGNGLILHHTCGRDGYDPSKLSVVEPAARWMAYVTKVVRYSKQDLDDTPMQGLKL